MAKNKQRIRTIFALCVLLALSASGAQASPAEDEVDDPAELVVSTYPEVEVDAVLDSASCSGSWRYVPASDAVDGEDSSIGVVTAISVAAAVVTLVSFAADAVPEVVEDWMSSMR